MPIRKATLKETREWLGAGLVMPGPKPPSSSKKSSTESNQNQTTTSFGSPEQTAGTAQDEAISEKHGAGADPL
jgi:hypothetical protein